MNATQLGLSDLAMLLGPDHPGAEVCMTANKEVARLRAEVERLRGALREIISNARSDGHEQYARIARAALEGKP